MLYGAGSGESKGVRPRPARGKNQDRIQKGYGLALWCRKRGVERGSPHARQGVKNQDRILKRIRSRFMVPEAGVEPAPCRQDRILSPARLPIPSFRLICTDRARIGTVLFYHSLRDFARRICGNLRMTGGGTGIVMRAVDLPAGRVSLPRARIVPPVKRYGTSAEARGRTGVMGESAEVPPHRSRRGYGLRRLPHVRRIL